MTATSILQASAICDGCNASYSFEFWSDREALEECVSKGEFFDGCDCGQWCCEGTLRGKVLCLECGGSSCGEQCANAEGVA